MGINNSALFEFNLLIFMVLVIAAISSYFGMQLQRHRYGEQLSGYLCGNRQYRWISGIALSLLGGFGRFIVLSFTPQVLVAIVAGGTMIVMNSLSLMTSQYERISKADIFGVMYILSGIFLVTWFCPPEELEDMHELIEQFLQPIFLIYIGLLGCVVLKTLDQITTGDCYAQNALKFTLIESGDKWFGRRTSLAPLYYASISGIAASVSLLFAKCSAESIRMTLATSNQSIYFTPYLFLFVMLCATIPQKKWMNRALKVGDARSVFLVYQISSIVFGVLGGILLLHEYVTFSAASFISLFMSLICMSVGSYLLVQREYISSHKDEDYNTEVILLGASTCLLEDSDMPVATLAYPIINDEVPYVEGQYKPPAMLQFMKLDKESEY